MRFLALVFLVSLSAGVAVGAGKRAAIPEPIPSASPSCHRLSLSGGPAEPIPCPTYVVVPTIAGKYISIGKIIGATDKEAALIAEGLRKANAMIDTKCFQQWILAAKYTENQGLTQTQILSKILSEPTTVDFEMYTGNFKANHVYKTMGYENDPFDGVVHANRYFIHTTDDIADLILHEDRGHSLGFRHDSVKATSDPYGMNYADEGCSHMQMMQARGGKQYKPPGIKLEIRKNKGKRTT